MSASRRLAGPARLPVPVGSAREGRSMKAPRETDIVRACLQLLQLRKVPAWRNNTGAAAFAAGGRRRFVRFGVAGAADVFGVLPPSGRLLAVEVKVPGGRVRPAQR